MADSKKPEAEKKAYTKPTLTEVRLVPGEAVLSMCKDGGNYSICLPDPSCDNYMPTS